MNPPQLTAQNLETLGMTATGAEDTNIDQKINNFYGASFGKRKGINPFKTGTNLEEMSDNASCQAVATANLSLVGNLPTNQNESTEELIKRVQSRFQETQ